MAVCSRLFSCAPALLADGIFRQMFEESMCGNFHPAGVFSSNERRWRSSNDHHPPLFERREYRNVQIIAGKNRCDK
jgi:hypothetical protein